MTPVPIQPMRVLPGSALVTAMVLLAHEVVLESHGGKNMRKNSKSQIRNPKPFSDFGFRVSDFGFRIIFGCLLRKTQVTSLSYNKVCPARLPAMSKKGAYG
jgi:hypothetical protein